MIQNFKNIKIIFLIIFDCFLGFTWGVTWQPLGVEFKLMIEFIGSEFNLFILLLIYSFLF